MRENFPLNYTNYDYRIQYTTLWLRELRHKSANSHHFGGLWVRIQARTENMSVIFFLYRLFNIFYFKLGSDSFGGVHKQDGPKRERGRLFYPMHVLTWFIVRSPVH